MRENNMDSKIKFDNVSICRNGKNAWAIGITGSEEAIKGEFYAWINHGATLARDLTWVTPTFGYFWTSPERLKGAIESREANHIMNSGELIEYKGIKRGFLPTVEARTEAAWQIINTLVPTFTVERVKTAETFAVANDNDMYAAKPDTDEADNFGLTRNKVQDCIDQLDARIKKAERREV